MCSIVFIDQLQLLLQALPGRIRKLSDGGMAALRELHEADDRATETETGTTADHSRRLNEVSAHLLGAAPYS